MSLAPPTGFNTMDSSFLKGFHLVNELMMDTDTKTPAQAIALLVLRRVSARHGLLPPGEFGGTAARQALLHAWLALEVAVSSEVLWNAVSRALGAETNIFRQHMDALLDLLSLAGLRGEESSVRQCYFEELRAARQAGLA